MRAKIPSIVLLILMLLNGMAAAADGATRFSFWDAGREVYPGNRLDGELFYNPWDPDAEGTLGMDGALRAAIFIGAPLIGGYVGYLVTKDDSASQPGMGEFVGIFGGGLIGLAFAIQMAW